MTKTARALIAFGTTFCLLLCANASAESQIVVNSGLTQIGDSFSAVSDDIKRILTDEFGVSLYPKENNPTVLSLELARGLVPHNGVFEDEVGDPRLLFCLQPDDRTFKRIGLAELFDAIAAQKICSELKRCNSRSIDHSVSEMRATIESSCAASPNLLKGVAVLSKRVDQQVGEYIRQVKSQDTIRDKNNEVIVAREQARLEAKRQAAAAAAVSTADGWPQLLPVVGLLRAGWPCEKIQGFAVVLVGSRDSGVPLTNVLQPIESGAFSAQERTPAEQLATQVYQRYKRSVESFQYAISETCRANR